MSDGIPGAIARCPLCDETRRESAAEQERSPVATTWHNATTTHCQRCGWCNYYAHRLNEMLDDLPSWKLSGYARAWSLKENSGISTPLRLIDIDPGTVERTRPKTIEEKATHLLRNLILLTPAFGTEIQLQLFHASLAFVEGLEESDALLALLDQRGLIRLDADCMHREVLVTAEGFAAGESQTERTLTVFVSSTCYELVDARAELCQFLDDKGHVVRASDDPERFDSSLQSDSIKVCLENLRNSDVVVVLLDRRYGPILKTKSGEQPYGEKSATHVEVEEARKHDVPIVTFVRAKAAVELDIIRGYRNNEDEVVKTKWIQRKRHDQQGLLSLFDALAGYQCDRTNWYSSFDTVVDLKKLVSKSLDDLASR